MHFLIYVVTDHKTTIAKILSWATWVVRVAFWSASRRNVWEWECGSLSSSLLSSLFKKKGVGEVFYQTLRRILRSARNQWFRENNICTLNFDYSQKATTIKIKDDATSNRNNQSLQYKETKHDDLQSGTSDGKSGRRNAVAPHPLSKNHQ